MQYDNEKRFILFPKKNANPKAPNYTGSITINGKEWELSGWDKQGKNGGNFISGSMKEPYKQGEQKPKNNSVNSDEDIPF
jgi:hypothetical protein